MLIDQNDKTMAVVSTNAARAAYLRTGHAAEYLGLGKSTLERLRVHGGGPKFRILGARVVSYAITDLDEWASQHVRLSTSEAA